MTGLYPPAARLVRSCITKVGKAQTRHDLRLAARDATNAVKHELHAIDKKLHDAMQKAVAEREEMLALLRDLSATVKAKLGDLNDD